MVEEVASSINSLLKYQLALGPHKWSAGGGGEKTKERFVLLIDASQPIPSSTTRSKTTPSSTKYKATSLLLSNLVSNSYSKMKMESLCPTNLFCIANRICT